jgi:hypothetical protein
MRNSLDTIYSQSTIAARLDMAAVDTSAVDQPVSSRSSLHKISFNEDRK